MAFFSFLSWFRPWWKTTDTDYETVLSRLSSDISDVQERLLRVRQRERRASVQLTLYAVAILLAYASFVWFISADDRPFMSKSERLRLWAPVWAGLLLIISARSVVRWWYTRVSNGEERHLRSLQRARRKKIDEIKQATKYDRLRTLLEKYDDTPTGQRASQKGAIRGKQEAKTATTATGNPPTTPKKGQTLAQPTVPAHPDNVSKQASFQTPQQQLRFEKTWLDRVADKVLGVDSQSQQLAAEQRYALICRVCFTHNGLCPKEDWEEVQYICPRCGTFNTRRPSSKPVSSPWKPALHVDTPSAHSSPLQKRGSSGLSESEEESTRGKRSLDSLQDNEHSLDSEQAPELVPSGTLSPSFDSQEAHTSALQTRELARQRSTNLGREAHTDAMEVD